MTGHPDNPVLFCPPRIQKKTLKQKKYLEFVTLIVQPRPTFSTWNEEKFHFLQ